MAWLSVVLLAAALVVCRADDLYGDLGLPRGAAPSEVKKAFRRLSREWHPDVSSDPNAKERYATILRAYNVLDDPAKRAEFDRFGVVPGEQRPPQGDDFPHFFRGQRRRAPIRSSVPDLTLLEWMRYVEPYRGARIRLVHVFSEESHECHVFGPAWEALATSSPLRRLVDFYRVEVDRDSFLIETVGLPDTVPAVVAVIDGKQWVMGPDQLAPQTAQRAVSDFVMGLYTDVSAELATPPLASLKQLRAAVVAQRFRVPLVAVAAADANSAHTALMLRTALSSAVRVVAVSPAAVKELAAHCPHEEYRTLWLWHNHTSAVCEAARYPAYKLLDDAAALGFVERRAVKRPLPVLTNASFDDICGVADDPVQAADGPVVCVCQVIGGDASVFQVLLPELLKDVPLAFKVSPCVVDPGAEPHFAEVAGVGRGPQLHLVAIARRNQEHWRAHSGDRMSAVAFISEVARTLGRRGAAKPRGQGLRGTLVVDRFPVTKWRSAMWGAEWLYRAVPFAGGLLLLALWYLVSMATRRSAAKPRAAPRPQPRPQPSRPQPQPQTQGSGAHRHGHGPPPHRPQGHDPRPREAPVPPRDPTRPEPLAKADMLAAGSGLVVLLFPVDGARLPPDWDGLRSYPNVRVRVVQQRHRSWWRWLEVACGRRFAAVRDAATGDRMPVVAAVRPKRAMGAVMPPGRALQLWVDSILEGATPVNIPLGATLEDTE